eukprot:4462806-Pleurochrysis_carterae.AAC.2
MKTDEQWLGTRPRTVHGGVATQQGTPTNALNKLGPFCLCCRRDPLPLCLGSWRFAESDEDTSSAAPIDLASLPNFRCRRAGVRDGRFGAQTRRI